MSGDSPVTAVTVEGMSGLQAAISMFGEDQVKLPHRASCTVCSAYHVAAADEGEARHLVLLHIDQEHQLVDYWEAGVL